MLFEVRFHSAMTDRDLAHLARLLDLVTHMHRKLPVDPNGPGVVRLDGLSALYLERGERDDEWLLEARSWRTPSPEIAHEWHLLAAYAASKLDRAVQPPPHLAEPPATPGL